jgi:hypothetical protein
VIYKTATGSWKTVKPTNDQSMSLKMSPCGPADVYFLCFVSRRVCTPIVRPLSFAPESPQAGHFVSRDADEESTRQLAGDAWVGLGDGRCWLGGAGRCDGSSYSSRVWYETVLVGLEPCGRHVTTCGCASFLGSRCLPTPRALHTTQAQTALFQTHSASTRARLADDSSPTAS